MNITAGVEITDYRNVIVRVWAWQEPVLSEPDPDDQTRRILQQTHRGILVERRLYRGKMEKPRVLWAYGSEIGNWERKQMRPFMKQRIEFAMAETLRLLGRHGRQK